MEKFYSTTVVAIGPEVQDFLSERMLILFDETVPHNLRKSCVLHRGEPLAEKIRKGDVVRIGGREYKVVKVGNMVEENMKNLGHVTLHFDGNADRESLEGSIYLEKGEVPDVQVGDVIEIFHP